MIRLLRSEWRKIMTTRLWWGMLLGAVALAALAVVGQIAGNGSRGNPAPPLSDPSIQRSIAASAAAGGIFAIVVGIIIVTTEFRHFTSRPTFLLEPRRGRVIGAKLVVSAAVGLMYGAACAATTVAIMVPWLAAKNVTIGWRSNGVLQSLVGAVLVVTIYAIVGVGVGALVRNQIAAVIGTLAYLFVVEGLISVIPVIKDYYRFLPGAAASAVTQPSRTRGDTLLTPLQGALLFLGWGLLFSLGAWLLSMRRDIP